MNPLTGKVKSQIESNNKKTNQQEIERKAWGARKKGLGGRATAASWLRAFKTENFENLENRESRMLE